MARTCLGQDKVLSLAIYTTPQETRKTASGTRAEAGNDAWRQVRGWTFNFDLSADRKWQQQKLSTFVWSGNKILMSMHSCQNGPDRLLTWQRYQWRRQKLRDSNTRYDIWRAQTPCFKLDDDKNLKLKWYGHDYAKDILNQAFCAYSSKMKNPSICMKAGDPQRDWFRSMPIEWKAG